MISRIKKIFFHELVTIVVCSVVTILSFLILALWRYFDTETFSFLQIIVVTLIIATFLYFVSLSSQSRLSNLFRRRELAAIAISFTIVAFFVLNVDRSRSIYLIKWVAHHEPHGVTAKELVLEHKLSGRDRQDILQRIGEQKSSGTLEEKHGELHLTLRGSILAHIFEFIAKFENLKGYSRS